VHKTARREADFRSRSRQKDKEKDSPERCYSAGPPMATARSAERRGERRRRAAAGSASKDEGTGRRVMTKDVGAKRWYHESTSRGGRHSARPSRDPRRGWRANARASRAPATASDLRSSSADTGQTRCSAAQSSSHRLTREAPADDGDRRVVIDAEGYRARRASALPTGVRRPGERVDGAAATADAPVASPSDARAESSYVHETCAIAATSRPTAREAPDARPPTSSSPPHGLPRPPTSLTLTGATPRYAARPAAPAG